MPDDDLWDAAVAARYDDELGRHGDPAVIAATVDLLADMAGGGRALEFAVGTGRIAIPLAQRGIEVHGIDSSNAMADGLRAAPGGDLVGVTVGDMATTLVGEPGSFDLVFLVFNGITNLLEQSEQVDCFRNAARHLRIGGSFVVETFVPALQRLPVGEVAVPFDLSEGHIGIDEYDVVAQSLTSHHVTVRDGRAHTFRSPHRYVWPSELDLMAELAGLERTGRWGDWDRSDFTATSTDHVSVWRKRPVQQAADGTRSAT